MRAFPVRLPSGARYWTVLDDDLAVVGEVDAFLRHVRFGRDGSELTTRAYAGGIALFLRWCAQTRRTWQAGVEHLGCSSRGCSMLARRSAASTPIPERGGCWRVRAGSRCVGLAG